MIEKEKTTAHVHHIQFGSTCITFNLSFQDRKRLKISVYPEGEIEVLAPTHVSEAEVLLKVRQKAPWIQKQLNYFRSYKPSTPPRQFVNGETHLYLGRQYRLKVIPATHPDVKVYRGQILVYATNSSKEKVDKQIQDWYKRRAEIIFQEILQETIVFFYTYNIQMPFLFIRPMAKRWGSCTVSGKIILNSDLIRASKGCIQYVIIHELCHLVHHNHNKAFFDLMERMMPDWRIWKKRLEYDLA